MSLSSPDWAALHEFLARHRRLLLTTHINPDGDGLGSEVAMALWLEQSGHEVRIVNDSPVPAAFRFLEAHHPIELFREAEAERWFEQADALVVLDTSNRQRIGRLAPLLDRHVIPVAVVDHHVSHAGFGVVNVIEPRAAAAGEIVYELIRESGGTITRAIAESLYVAVMTDTGSFRYSNTDPYAHRMAADLLGLGIDPQELHLRVYAHASPARLRFFGEVLSRLEVLADGRLIVLDAAPEQFVRLGLTGADTDGLIDLPRNIQGVDVVALFSEVDPGRTKLSLRSNGRVAIDAVVGRLGGGGHPHAAGAMVHATRAELRARMIPELTRLVEAAKAGDASAPPGSAPATAPVAEAP